MKLIKPVFLLDFDGTLVDSLSLLYEVYCHFLEERGAKGDPQGFWELSGSTFPQGVGELRDKHGLEGSTEALYTAYVQRLHEVYPLNLKLLPGAQMFLEASTALGGRLAIVTAGNAQLVERYLEQQGIDKYFECVISAEGLDQSKPHPEVYEKALKAMKVTAEEAVAIEDSLQGVQAAHGAGIEVIRLHYCHDYQEPHDPITELRDIEVYSHWESLHQRLLGTGVNHEG